QRCASFAIRGRYSPTRMPGTLVRIVLNSPRISGGCSGLGSNVSRWLIPPLRKISTHESAATGRGGEARARRRRKLPRPRAKGSIPALRKCRRLGWGTMIAVPCVRWARTDYSPKSPEIQGRRHKRVVPVFMPETMHVADKTAICEGQILMFRGGGAIGNGATVICEATVLLTTKKSAIRPWSAPKNHIC